MTRMRLAGLAFSLFGLVAVSATALAQQGPASPIFGGPTSPATSAPSSPGSPAAPSQTPAIQGQPVQSPTITNEPGATQQQLLQQMRDAQRATPAQPAAPAAIENTEFNEFQDFVAASIGRRLPLFGYNLFQGVPSTFAPVENVPVTPDYVIGPGDELLIRAWGQIDVDYRTIVDRNGSVTIPRVGVVTVSGIRYQDLTTVVRNSVSRIFRNFELVVTLGQLRSIQVFVVGQARRPGSYTVSSLSTLVNAIFAAGGPSGRGSMRGIQLKRGDKVVAEIDLYELLVSGSKSRDAQLLPGDVIYFPPIGQLAALAGSVNNPAIFELKGQSNVSNLIDLAGGLTTTAQTRRASIERIDERKSRTVDHFALDYDGLKKNVKDGDLVAVFSVSPRFENAVTLRGNVAAPLRYPYTPGMRIRDLIPDKEALITPDYYARRNISARVDTVTQGSLAYDVRRLSDEINWDYAVIERLNENDLSTTLIPFSLGKAVLENDPANNLPLVPEDVVTVFSKADIAASSTRRSVVVRLEGEFNNAGVYQAKPGETLRQLIARIGGITPAAYTFGAEFNRESTRKNQEERLEQAVRELEQSMRRASADRARNVTSPEDAASLKQEAEAQVALISRLRTLKPTGRIVFELPDSASMADLPDIALEDGDRLFIPALPSMVSVFGTVFNESAFLYAPDKNVADYLALAGGPRKEADKRSIYVLRANGSVASSMQAGRFFGSVGNLRSMPGDAIVVPEDFTRTSWVRDLKDWTAILYQFGLGAAALKVLTE